MLRDALPPLIRLMSIGRAAMTYTVTLTDGRTLSAPADRPPFEATSALTRLEFAPHDRTLTATTVNGDTVVFEVPTDAEDATPPIRPVVYLDQNQWSAIANSIHAPGRIRRLGEGEAAGRIIELSRERRLTLPASAGHLHETTKWTDNTRRYALGLTVLQLSHGWMMRNPLQVRRDEIRAVLPTTTPADAMRPVITLLPNTLNESTVRRTGPGYTPSPDLATQLAFLASTLIVASARLNDLSDMVYLSCAAAYSDVVVCERHMGHMLRRAAQRLDRRVVVCTSLAEAIDTLAGRLN